ncbi:protein IWS1 homolog, partial [Lates japonicus]
MGSDWATRMRLSGLQQEGSATASRSDSESFFVGEMDGEEDDFMSGSRSDDGGGTPVQDEHPASDGEEVRSDRPQSEDEGSNDEDASHAMETSGAASGSDNEDRRGADSDSEAEAPGG